MKVIIRTDASVEIGSGHVMRCLTVAKNLRENGCQVQFWMEPLAGNLIDYVASEGFGNSNEAEQADLYIIDHYGIDAVWEREIRAYTSKIMVIDDLANRQHECDILLDQNVVPNFETRYDEFVPDHCVKLLGPKYLIMRDEFIEARDNLSERGKKIERLLVFMGGSDPTHETVKVLEALQSFTFDHIDVVVGDSNVFKKQIEEICEKRGYQFHCQVNYMARLMQAADFAIGAGGSTLWERCYLNLPSSSTIVADNQRLTTQYAAKVGLTINMGFHHEVNFETYSSLLEKLSNNDLFPHLKIGRQKHRDFGGNNCWLEYLMK